MPREVRTNGAMAVALGALEGGLVGVVVKTQFAAVADAVWQTERLTLPHPRLAERRFVLQPWADLAPNFVVPPPFGETVQTLLEACSDDTSIRRVETEENRRVS